MSNPIDIVESELHIIDKHKFILDTLARIGYNGDKHPNGIPIKDYFRGGGRPMWLTGFYPVLNKQRNYGEVMRAPEESSMASWYEDDIIAELLALVAIGVTGYIVLADQWHELNKYVLGSDGVNVCGVKAIEWDDPHTHYDMDGRSYLREDDNG